MIWSFALFVPICACYLMWEFNAIKNATIMDLMKDFVDISPAIILLVFNRPQSAIFLMFCLMANEFIYDNWILGGALFAVGYATASFLACYGSGFYIVIALTAVLAILIFEIPLLIVWKGSARLKVCAACYGIIALLPCVYAFEITLNPGFLLLAAGDIGLGFYGVCEKKWIKIVANVIYFAATCFIPLSL